MRSRLKFLAGAVLGLALIVWFAKDLDWAKVGEAVGKADWRLLTLATVLTLSTYIIRALRWKALLAPVSPNVSLRNLFAATVVGFSAVFVVGRAGEVIRPVVLSSKEHVRPSAGFATIMIERIFDAVTIVLIFAVNLLFFDRPLVGGVSLAPIRLAGGTLLACSAVGIFGLYMLRRHRMASLEFLDRRLARFGRRFRRMVVSFVGNFAEALSVLHDARELVIASAYSLLLWGICVYVNVLTMQAFAVDSTISDSIFVIGFSMVGSLVPTPGGAAGAFHTATSRSLMLLGVDTNTAAGISIVMHLLGFGSALIFGIYYVLRGGISMTRLRAALSEDLNSQADFQVMASRS